MMLHGCMIEGNVNTLAETGSSQFGAKAVSEGLLETCQLILNYYLCSIGYYCSYPA